jgi:hypothetical protein
MDPSYIPPRVYQFRVIVQGISPLIWRRLLVRSDMSLATLHAALQVVFAWSDTYLHAFHIHGKAYQRLRSASQSLQSWERMRASLEIELLLEFVNAQLPIMPFPLRSIYRDL